MFHGPIQITVEDKIQDVLQWFICKAFYPVWGHFDPSDALFKI